MQPTQCTPSICTDQTIFLQQHAYQSAYNREAIEQHTNQVYIHRQQHICQESNTGDRITSSDQLPTSNRAAKLPETKQPTTPESITAAAMLRSPSVKMYIKV
ncbi:hypothetical protein CsSME_00043112 [Camellia sinensis var. sinensis]